MPTKVIHEEVHIFAGPKGVEKTAQNFSVCIFGGLFLFALFRYLIFQSFRLRPEIILLSVRTG